MLVKTIIDNECGSKWEIYKHTEQTGFPYPVYTINYSEFYKNCGWRLIINGTKMKDYCTKKFIKEFYDVIVN